MREGNQHRHVAFSANDDSRDTGRVLANIRHSPTVRQRRRHVQVA